MLTVNFRKQLGAKRQIKFLLDISFAINDGITVLVGASGSGKTTTLRVIAGILAPDAGFIKLDSQIYFDSRRGINLPIQKRRLGFVFQNYALFPHLSGEQNIAYGIKTADKKVRREKARELLSLMRIEHLSRRLPREMSGGEQQRVALARALAADPAIILLDEPLSAVDIQTRHKLLDEIENAQRRADIPFLYVTHNEAEAARLAAHQITLDSGRVIEEKVF